MKRLRLDMYETPVEGALDGEVRDDVARLGDDENDDSRPTPAAMDDDVPDVFDELLRQSGAPNSLQQRAIASGSGGGAAAAAAVTPAPLVGGLKRVEEAQGGSTLCEMGRCRTGGRGGESG